MIRDIVKLAALAAVVTMAVTMAHDEHVVGGWTVEGAARSNYVVSLDKMVRHNGQASARIIHSRGGGKGSATLTQSIDATPFRGKSIQVSAWIKTREVTFATLLVRVLSSPTHVVAHGDMGLQAVTGSHEWQRHELVLDVDPTATIVTIGAKLVGLGTAWFDDIDIKVLDHQSMAYNGFSASQAPEDARLRAPTVVLHAPVNLGFEP